MLTQSKQHRSIKFGIIPGGLAIALLVWLAAFIGRFPGIALSSPSLLTLLLVIMLFGAMALALFGGNDRSASAMIKRTAFSLSVTGLVNILLIGSVVGASSLAASSNPAAVDRVTLSALLWVPGSFIATVLLGLVGGWLASIFRSKLSDTAPAPISSQQAALALVIVLTTLCLILVGGVVTSAEAGLSVPDWPTSYGWNMFLFPFTKMVGGIYYEHAHRLIGSLVGLETLILFIWLWRNPPLKYKSSSLSDKSTAQSVQSALPDRCYSWWGAIALIFVCVQGVLGGMRVFQNDTRIAVVHALTALVFLAIITGLLWHLTHALQTPTTQTSATTPKPRLLRNLSIFLIIAVLLQTLAGAIYRHLAIQAAFHLHLTGAGVILIIAVIMLANIMMGNITRTKNAGPIVRTVFIIFIITVCQIALGMAAWMVTARYDQIDQTTSDWIIFITAGHVVGGAVLLVASVWLSLHTRHFLSEPLAS